ncbi:MAG: hypothetical protein J5736_00490, partial [Bacilli bacterium]|nr:hypothetical protein [Bacilli bacterium]
YVESGARGDSFKKEEDGTFVVPISPRTRLDAIYTFSLLEEGIPENAKTMISYVDEHRKTHYAPFSLPSRYGQILLFKKKAYEDGGK